MDLLEERSGTRFLRNINGTWHNGIPSIKSTVLQVWRSVFQTRQIVEGIPRNCTT